MLETRAYRLTQVCTHYQWDIRIYFNLSFISHPLQVLSVYVNETFDRHILIKHPVDHPSSGIHIHQISWCHRSGQDIIATVSVNVEYHIVDIGHTCLQSRSNMHTLSFRHPYILQSIIHQQFPGPSYQCVKQRNIAIGVSS